MSLDSRTRSMGVDSTAASLGDRFHPLYRRVFDDDSSFAATVDRKLAQSRTAEPVELYLSRALGVGILLGALFWVAGAVFGRVLVSTGRVRIERLLDVPVESQTLLTVLHHLRDPALILAAGALCGAIGFAIGFGWFLVLPYWRASVRKREIDLLLPDSISFLYALSVGGLNQLEVIEAIANAEDTYGEVAHEFQSVLNETTYAGVDYRSAIRTQAAETPSEALAQFLTDLLSIVDSGGDLERFLEDQTDAHMRRAKQHQQRTLETLELFGELYITLSLFPLLLVVVLVIMQLVPDADVPASMLYVAVYALIPLIGLGFLVLVSTVTHDEPGDGYLRAKDGSVPTRATRSSGIAGEYTLFDRIASREETDETRRMLRRPDLFFRDHPRYTLAVTVPAALVAVTTLIVTGSTPTSWNAFVRDPVWGTFVYLYLPLYVTAVPLACCYEWDVRRRTVVVTRLSETLRKLSSANETGLTLLESLEVVATTSRGTLAREFGILRTKVDYGTRLKTALIEFNNAYHIPRLARTTRLIGEAQEASNRLSPVLRVAARASETHDELERDRRSRTRMQVAIVLVTFLTMVAVLAILETQFVETMAGLETDRGSNPETSAAGSAVAAELNGTADADLLSMLFFHAITIQALLAGLVCGYIRNGRLLSGLKYVLGLSAVALGCWVVVV